jgi:peptidoglycan/LPS O-acetylase OafA/YrhL
MGDDLGSSSAAAPWGYLALLAVWPVALSVADGLSRWRPGPATAMARLGSLDGVRGFLALAVMAHHFRIAWNWRLTGRWELPAETLFKNLGPAGVIVFFMITGFLFWGKLVGAGGRLDVRCFVIARVFRIYPAYLLSLAAIAALSWLAADTVSALPASQAWKSLWTWLTFGFDPDLGFRGTPEAHLINAGVIWTLQYEWVFYAVLPVIGLILLALRPGAGSRVAALVILCALMSLTPAAPLGWFQWHIAAGFAYGALTYEALRLQPLAGALRGATASILGLVALGVMLALPGYPFGALAFLLLWGPFLAVAAGNTMFGVLASRPAVALGDASYSLYLFHGLFVFAFFRLVPGEVLGDAAVWLGLPLVAAATSLLALACFRLVEAPSIAMGRRLAGERRPVRASEEVAP